MYAGRQRASTLPRIWPTPGVCTVGSLQRIFLVLVVLSVTAASCAPSAPSGTPDTGGTAPEMPTTGRTLRLAVQHEPPGLLPKSLTSTGRLDDVIRLFNA